MRSRRRRICAAGALLVLLLPAQRVGADDVPDGQPKPAAPEPSPAPPDLADLIPLATGLADRLASLQRLAADQGDVAELERQASEVAGRIDGYDKDLEALTAASDARAGQLAELRTEIASGNDALTDVARRVTARVRTFGDLRKEWLAQQTSWNAWQAAFAAQEPLEEITATVRKAQGTIATALALLRQVLKPLLDLQDRVGTLETRIGQLTTELEARISLSRGSAADASPAMLSEPYRAQLKSELASGRKTGFVTVSWPGKAFVAEHGWVALLQVVVSLGLAVLFARHRAQLEELEHWRFLARRPIAAGTLVGVVSGVVFYGRIPDIVRLILSAILVVAFVRLVATLVRGGWRRQFVYSTPGVIVMTNLCYGLGLPLALFRLYILVMSLLTVACCVRWAVESRRAAEPWFYAAALRLVAVLFLLVAGMEVRGDAKTAEFLFVVSFRTLAVVLIFGLLRYVVRGAVEWAVQSSAKRDVALVRDRSAWVIQRLGLLLDVLVGAAMLSILLMTWQVYDSPLAAMSGVLTRQVTIGAQEISIGLVLLAGGALGASYMASGVLQTLVTENVLARRNVDTGVTVAVSRLLHYALISFGVVVALAVLGVDITKIVVLISALGVGIGFGLQTIVNNFVCGLILLFERPLRVGDTIELGGRWAKIAKIGLRSTTVRTLDQADVIVPNTDLITNQVTNWTLTDRHARIIVRVKVATGSDVAVVIQTLKESALAYPGVMKKPEPTVLLHSFGGGAMEFEVHAWIVDVDMRLQAESDLYQALERRFREQGITPE